MINGSLIDEDFSIANFFDPTSDLFTQMRNFDPGELRSVHLSAQISCQPLVADRPKTDDVPELM